MSQWCEDHKLLVEKITEISEAFSELRGELKYIIPEIKKTSDILGKLSQKISAEESSRKASWKTVTISISLGALLSGFLWSLLSFLKQGV